jgi:linoleoyl-CoA desaturase
MNLQSYKFAVSDVEFFSVLRKRVNHYFEENKISKHANASMVLKTILMLSLFFVPYLILLFGSITEPLHVFLLCMPMGLGMAGIGLCVMHDANHGSYSSKKWINNLLGLTLNVIGANAVIWKLQHNRLHHTYTNIEGADDDLVTPPFLRMSPGQKKLSIHKYQYIYAWFFYCFSTLARVIVKEFVQLKKFTKIGLLESSEKSTKAFMQLVGWKIFYVIVMIAIPIYMIEAPLWSILLSFLSMHLVNGLIMSTIFQVAHIMPNCSFTNGEETKDIEDSWVRHEMKTTTNFSPKNPLFTWFIGGLNYQVEHHLFPKICHVHYPEISGIVEKTANEFGLPYNSEPSFLSATKNHVKMLYNLGHS